ncbi:hypothetical protein EDB19DRAFT_1830541 [Suillus lakei]|nr:hypothetical protein EDB19DRAFT_1830541 [Suillus lakei]
MLADAIPSFADHQPHGTSFELGRILGHGGKLETSWNEWNELLDHGAEAFDLSFPPIQDSRQASRVNIERALAADRLCQVCSPVVRASTSERRKFGVVVLHQSGADRRRPIAICLEYTTISKLAHPVAICFADHARHIELSNCFADHAPHIEREPLAVHVPSPQKARHTHSTA